MSSSENIKIHVVLKQMINLLSFLKKITNDSIQFYFRKDEVEFFQQNYLQAQFIQVHLERSFFAFYEYNMNNCSEIITINNSSLLKILEMIKKTTPSLPATQCVEIIFSTLNPDKLAVNSLPDRDKQFELKINKNPDSEENLVAPISSDFLFNRIISVKKLIGFLETLTATEGDRFLVEKKDDTLIFSSETDMVNIKETIQSYETASFYKLTKNWSGDEEETGELLDHYDKFTECLTRECFQKFQQDIADTTEISKLLWKYVLYLHWIYLKSDDYELAADDFPYTSYHLPPFKKLASLVDLIEPYCFCGAFCNSFARKSFLQFFCFALFKIFLLYFRNVFFSSKHGRIRQSYNCFARAIT